MAPDTIINVVNNDKRFQEHLCWMFQTSSSSYFDKIFKTGSSHSLKYLAPLGAALLFIPAVVAGSAPIGILAGGVFLLNAFGIYSLYDQYKIKEQFENKISSFTDISNSSWLSESGKKELITSKKKLDIATDNFKTNLTIEGIGIVTGLGLLKYGKHVYKSLTRSNVENLVLKEWKYNKGYFSGHPALNYSVTDSQSMLRWINKASDSDLKKLAFSNRNYALGKSIFKVELGAEATKVGYSLTTGRLFPEVDNPITLLKEEFSR